jgi:hypothetical protein
MGLKFNNHIIKEKEKSRSPTGGLITTNTSNNHFKPLTLKNIFFLQQVGLTPIVQNAGGHARYYR